MPITHSIPVSERRNVELPSDTRPQQEAIENADTGCEQQNPGDCANEGRNKDRHFGRAFQEAAQGRVGTHKNPSEYRAKNGGQDGGTAGHDQRIAQGVPIDRAGQDLRKMIEGEAGRPWLNVNKRVVQNPGQRRRYQNADECPDQH